MAKKAGRPKKIIDTELLEKLSRIQCSIVEMAAILDCHPDTLADNYSDIIQKGREHGKMSLRRKQMETALNGNVTMLIWLGKNYLGQRDNSLIDLKTRHESSNKSTQEQVKELAEWLGKLQNVE